MDEPDVLHVAALGTLLASRDGARLDLGSPKQRQVLATLIVHAPHPVGVDRLIDELWPTRPPGDPRRSLQVYVSGLRRVLGAERIRTDGRGYVLHLGPCDVVDRSEFLALYDALHPPSPTTTTQTPTAAGPDQHERVIAQAERAEALWRGPAWDGLRDGPAVASDGVRLDAQRLDVAARALEARLALGRHREVIGELEERVRQEPLREDFRGQLMLALHRSGRTQDALATYAAGRTLCVEETGLEPGQAVRDLHLRILEDDPALQVEDAVVRRRRHLPAPATAFVGRRSEVDELVALFRDEGVRAVTLTGAGGIGKTRVGLQVAHELAPAFADGVWFVPLADLTEQHQVARAIAETLGVDEIAGDLMSSLVERLADSRLLLVLDNAEQLDDTTALLRDLLAAGPGVAVLVTSRTRLDFYGETVVGLEPLALEEAVPLFVARARSVDRRFDAGRDAMDGVRRVCEALDRLPLALELVAARVDEVPMPELLERLGDVLDLADRGPRDRSPRQQALRRSIVWSVDLLPTGQAEVFARLSAFIGGFDVDAAEAVAGASEETIRALVRASLVVPDGQDRWRLLETVRAWALERCGDDLPAVRERHARWCLDLARASVDGMRGGDAAPWVARVSRERGNMRAALSYLASTADRDDPVGSRLLRLSADLGLFWYRTAPGDPDVEWLQRALDAAPEADPLLRGRARYALAICFGEQGRAEEALAHARSSYATLSAAGDEGWVARALNSLAGLTRDLGRADEAVPMMEECIRQRRRLQDPALPLSIALTNLALTALDLGDTVRARSALEECLGLAADDPVELALTHTGLADLAVAEGDLDDAAVRLRASIPVLREREQQYRLIEVLDTVAALAVLRGRRTEALALVAAADRAMAEDGSVQVPADAALRARRVWEPLGLVPGSALDAEVLDLDAALDLALERVL